MNMKRNLHHKSTFTMSLVSSKIDILTFHPPPNSHRTISSGKIQFCANFAPIYALALSLSLTHTHSFLHLCQRAAT